MRPGFSSTPDAAGRSLAGACPVRTLTTIKKGRLWTPQEWVRQAGRARKGRCISTFAIQVCLFLCQLSLRDLALLSDSRPDL